eukprot:6401471-Amphidinium_carterae.1
MGDARSLTGQADRFGGVTINLTAADVADQMAFQKRLSASMSLWRSEGKRAVWAHVPCSAAAAVPFLVEEGFDWHHAQPARQQKEGEGYAMLTAWLKDSENSLPMYATSQVGVGGLVLNPSGEVLMIQERANALASLDGMWKIPGGLVDPGEDLATAVAREVFEETGVKAEPEGIISLHHRHGYRFGISDLYFSVRMHCASSEHLEQTRETIAVTWMTIAEAMASEKVIGFNKAIIGLANQPCLSPHLGTFGSRMVKGDFYLYAAASKLDPNTGKLA